MEAKSALCHSNRKGCIGAGREREVPRLASSDGNELIR